MRFSMPILAALLFSACGGQAPTTEGQQHALVSEQCRDFLISTCGPCGLQDRDGNLAYDAIGFTEMADRCNWDITVMAPRNKTTVCETLCEELDPRLEPEPLPWLPPREDAEGDQDGP